MSLRRMSLREFVIVDALDVDFEPGFTVLTGETGAGKSILIDALQLVLGARADAGVVREGAVKCELSAEWDLPTHLTPWLDEHGFDHPDDSLLLRRQIDAQGKSRAWINGSPATLTQLKTLADDLVDIHGQHAWQGLTRPDTVRDLLDSYGGIDNAVVAPLWRRWRDSAQALQMAQAQQTTRAQETERLQWQLQEVGKLAPGEDEWDELNQRHSRLSHAAELASSTQQALSLLDEDEPSARQLIHQAASALRDQQHHDPSLGAVADTLDAVLDQLQDACHDLHQGLSHHEEDPIALQAMDDRLSLWVSLAKRYRCAPPDLPQRVQAWQKELAHAQQQADLAALAQRAEDDHRALLAACDALHGERVAAARQLSEKITHALPALGMPGGRFEVAVHPLEAPHAHGQDLIELRVAGHAGVALKPLAKVASGGELSRIALAIAVTTGQMGNAHTLIFDEVDAGIGGAVAHTVGITLRALAQSRQVLAVTHLAQVAAKAHQHWQVSKHTAHGRTVSQLSPLRTDQRVSELARMLGGHDTPASLAHAQELLNDDRLQ